MLGFQPRAAQWGVLHYQKPLLANSRKVFFLSLGLHEQAPDARVIKNPLRSRTWFLVVGYTFEISNLDLLKDLKNVIDCIAFQ